MRKNVIITQLKNKLEELSGIEMMDVSPEMSFLQIGLDSLLLTQVALVLKNEFKVPISFRQLNEDLTSLDALASYIQSHGSPVEPEAVSSNGQALPIEKTSTPVSNPLPEAFSQIPVVANGSSPSVLGLVAQQIQLLGQQVALLSGQRMEVPSATSTLPSSAEGKEEAVQFSKKEEASELTESDKKNLAKPFGAIAKIETKASKLTNKQLQFIKDLERRYTDKTNGSKTYTQKHRAVMADPRVVSGFKPATKELSYPLVCNKSTGSSIWDIDGNQYIDLVNGFGSNILGYQPDFIKEALHNQIEKGFEIGPQHELAGEVSELIKELTQHERVGLCNTGSEAVLGAMRIVRTVSGKPLIVTFSDSYHGIHDEVLVRGTQKKKTFPAAPGVLPEAVKNILVLEYGNPESLTFIKNRAHEIAGVLVEPVQSRNPKLQPADFLKSLRALTTDLEIALIFDEIITGFRIHPQGAQGYFGVKADLATYGKVVGGGLSVGVIAGKKKFLDALDGGYWQFGDDSIPEVGVTYFAGTFVRHPLALAAAKASLTFIKSKGMDLSTELNKASEYLVTSLNALFAEQGVPIVVDHFGSLMKLIFKQEVLHQELLYVLLRERGIHLQDGFPMYLTLAHSKEDLDKVIQAFKESIALLVEFEFLPSVHPKEVETPAKSIIRQDAPPVPNARLGRDADGNPAWFIKDPVRAGKYLQIEI